MLAFIDSRCTTVCPLTAAILREALHRIGPAGSRRVALVAVNANPAAARVADVYRFSEEHGMLHQWAFLTGSPAKLEAVYKGYEVSVNVEQGGGVVHDSAIIIIAPDGRERLYYETLDSNARFTVESEIRALLAGMRQWLPGRLTAAAVENRQQHGSNVKGRRANAKPSREPFPRRSDHQRARIRDPRAIESGLGPDVLELAAATLLRSSPQAPVSETGSLARLWTISKHGLRLSPPPRPRSGERRGPSHCSLDA